MPVTLLTEPELRQCARIGLPALAAVRDAFTWLHEGRVEMPPIMHIGLDDRGGDIDIKSAYVRGLDSLAVKIASGFFGNPERGLPSSSAMVVVLSAETGFCEAVLLDNGYLTDLRTGLAGAVAAEALAPTIVRTVGVIGRGAQARYQVECLRLVRDFERVLVKARDPAREAAYAEQMTTRLGVPVTVAASLEALVRESDVLITTTPSRAPLVEAEWLHPGQHVTAMGSDLPGKQELGSAALARADLLVCDRRGQCERMGELRALLDAGGDASKVVELGEITSGHHAGRSGAEQLTICDLTGTGVQDTAIAGFALAGAREMGLGVSV